MFKFTKSIFTILMFAIIFSFSYGQTNNYDAWRLGLNLGLNYNMTGLGYQNLSPNGADFITLDEYDGSAIGPYVGLFGEYVSDSWWGVQLRLSYDNRNVTGEDDKGTYTSKFDIYANYLNIEPLLRINPIFIDRLSFYVGPQLALKLDATYDYKTDPAGDLKVSGKDIDGANSFAYGVMVGAAYDFLLAKQGDNNWRLAPFLDFSMLANQRKSNVPGADQDSYNDIWSTLTLRAGAKLSYEISGKPGIPWVDDKQFDNLQLITPAEGKLKVRTIDEYLPIIPHVFFDEGNNSIPQRYVQLDNATAKGFNEGTLYTSAAAKKTGKGTKNIEQMNAYYNILNVFAARMRENSSEKLNLIGSSPKDNSGQTIADNVKKYLVDVFGIDANRITTEGRELPRVPSGTAATPAQFKPLLDQENRRVEFVFANKDMLKPVKIQSEEITSVDNDLVFSFPNFQNVSNWTVNVNGEKGTYTYGPFTDDVERIDPAPLMTDVEEGVYTANVVINTKDGKQTLESRRFRLEKVYMKNVAQRFSIVFDYGKADAVKGYESVIRGEIAPKVQTNDFVNVKGHTDNIGNPQGNLKLSQDRANEVKDMMKDQFSKDNKTIDVRAYGFGENTSHSPFKNNLPEGRFYNRSVVMEIFPIE